ncbi:hypothetical protein GCM10027341_16080 [Spirosoma knui]
MTTAPQTNRTDERATDLIKTALNLMILFPDLPHDQALLRAKDWVGYFNVTHEQVRFEWA